MQKEKNQRLTLSNINSIQKVTAWGKTHQKYRKQVKAVLFFAFLWFYLLSVLRQFLENRRMRNIVCVTAVSILVICLCIYSIKMNVSDRFNHFVEEKLIQQEIVPDTEAAEQAAARPEEDLPDIAALKQQNPDCEGWLYIADINISYPVMQREEDMNYYLDKDFNENADSNGCLILDNGSSLERSGSNLIIHGQI